MLASYGLMMEYDPLGPVPRYQQIAGILRNRIEAGELEPDRPIPSETAIQQEFGVARATARHAVELLREWGLVVTVPGMGTYVRSAETPSHTPKGRGSGNRCLPLAIAADLANALLTTALETWG